MRPGPQSRHEGSASAIRRVPRCRRPVGARPSPPPHGIEPSLSASRVVRQSIHRVFQRSSFAHGRPAPVEYTLLDDYFSAGAAGAPPFFTSSCMVNRTQALAAGGFPAGHSRGEDLALWMKLAATAPVAVSTYVGCHYRRGADTLTAKCVTEPDVSMTTLDGSHRPPRRVAAVAPRCGPRIL